MRSKLVGFVGVVVTMLGAATPAFAHEHGYGDAEGRGGRRFERSFDYERRDGEMGRFRERGGEREWQRREGFRQERRGWGESERR